MSRPTADPGPAVRYALVPLALAGLLALGACSSSTSSGGTAPSSAPLTAASTTTDSTSPTTSGAAPTTPAGRTMSVRVTGKTVDPAPAQVPLGIGETLALTVTVDHDDELHIHGFEIEQEVTADVPTTVRLTGTQAGVFEVELHHPELLLMTIAVS